MVAPSQAALVAAILAGIAISLLYLALEYTHLPVTNPRFDS
jgi:hypothetical protein